MRIRPRLLAISLLVPFGAQAAGTSSTPYSIGEETYRSRVICEGSWNTSVIPTKTQGKVVATYGSHSYVIIQTGVEVSPGVFKPRCRLYKISLDGSTVTQAWLDTQSPTYYTSDTDSHNYMTLGIDEDGYIHVAGDMHVYPAQGGGNVPARWSGSSILYWRSAAPGDITSFVFKGGTPGERPPGSNHTYPEFFNDNNGKLYFKSRQHLGGPASLCLSVYDKSTRTWSAFGGTRIAQAIATEAGDGSYNLPALDLRFDASNNLHLATLQLNEAYPPPATYIPLAHGATDLMYAYSADGGSTLRGYDGSTFTYPITPAKATVLAHRASDNVPPEDVPYFMSTQLSVSLDRNENPVTTFVDQALYDSGDSELMFVSRNNTDTAWVESRDDWSPSIESEALAKFVRLMGQDPQGVLTLISSKTKVTGTPMLWRFWDVGGSYTTLDINASTPGTVSEIEGDQIDIEYQRATGNLQFLVSVNSWSWRLVRVDINRPQRYWRGGDPPGGSSPAGWQDLDNWYLDAAGTVKAPAVPGSAEEVVLHTTTAAGGENDRRDTLNLNGDREAHRIRVLPGASFDSTVSTDELDVFIIRRGSSIPNALTLNDTLAVDFQFDSSEENRILRLDGRGSGTSANGEAELILAGSGGGTVHVEGATDTVEISFDIADGDTPSRLIKTGPGTLVLNTPRGSTYSGGTTLGEGNNASGNQTRVGHNAALGTGEVTIRGARLSSVSSTPRTLANEVTFGDGGGTSAYLGDSTNNGTLTFTGPVNLDGGVRNIQVDSVVEITGVISDGAGGNGAIIKRGAGTLILSGNNAYSGETTVKSGVLKVGADNVVPHGSGKGDVTIETDGILDLSGHYEAINALLGYGTVDNTGGAARLRVGYDDASGTFSGVIQNTGAPLSLEKAYAGTMTLSGNSSFSGGVTIFNGVLRMAHAGALGTGNLLTMENANSGVLQLNMHDPTVSGLVSTSTDGDSVIENTHASNTAVLTVDVAAGQRLVYRDTLRDGGNAPLQLVKKGLGIQVLDSLANTVLDYSGSTLVENGTLVVNAHIRGSTSVTVNTNGFLSGVGVIDTNVTVIGTIAPGDDVGTLTVDGDLSLRGTYLCQMNGSNVDCLAVSGRLDLSSATLDVEELSPSRASVYVIATYGSLNGDFASVRNVPADYCVNTAYDGNQIALVRPVIRPPDISPTNLAANSFQDAFTMFWIEEQTVSLPADITVDALYPAGRTIGRSAVSSNVVLRAGARVTSYLLHLDSPAATTLSGSYSLTDPIFAVIFTTANLDATDAVLGLPGMTYPSLEGRGGLSESGDIMTVAPDGLSFDLTLEVEGSPFLDEIRFLTLSPEVLEAPVLSLPGGGSSTLALRITGQYGYYYTLQYRTNLLTEIWRDLPGWIRVPGEPDLFLSVPTGMDTRRYFRVFVE